MTEATPSNETCPNCQYCFIPMDMIINVGDNADLKLYCNYTKDKPLSGCILTEPLDYYDISVYDTQNNAWNEWASTHEVSVDYTCTNFKAKK